MEENKREVENESSGFGAAQALEFLLFIFILIIASLNLK